MRGSPLILLLAFGASASTTAAGDLFPWFTGSDPRIRASVFLDEKPTLAGSRVVIFPFHIDQQGEPSPPALEPYFLNSLAAHAEVEAARTATDSPWSALPEGRVARLSDIARLEQMAASASADGFDIVIWGRVHQVRRVRSEGLKSDVEVWVLDLEQSGSDVGALPVMRRAALPRIVWHARKRIEWKRRYPLDECLTLLADSFVSDWAPRLLGR